MASGITSDFIPFGTWPTHQALDIGLLFIETANQAIATPSGWTAVTNGSQGVGTAGSATATRLQVFWRRAAGSSETLAGVSIAGDHVIGQILTVRGCIATGNPIDVSAGDASTDADTTAVSIPGATTTVPATLLVTAVSNQVDSATFFSLAAVNPNASMIPRGGGQSAAGNGGGFNVHVAALANAGTYGATTLTLVVASRQGRVSLALKPA